MQSKDYANKTVGDFYIGKSYANLKETEKAVIYFKKIDTAFRHRQYFRQDFKEGYKFLIEYYKKKGRQDLQNMYSRRLITADSLLDTSDKEVTGKIAKKYDHKVLSLQNENLTQSMFYGLSPPKE